MEIRQNALRAPNDEKINAASFLAELILFRSADTQPKISHSLFSITHIKKHILIVKLSFLAKHLRRYFAFYSSPVVAQVAMVLW